MQPYYHFLQSTVKLGRRVNVLGFFNPLIYANLHEYFGRLEVVIKNNSFSVAKGPCHKSRFQRGFVKMGGYCQIGMVCHLESFKCDNPKPLAGL
jgi:hypothetical protein